MSGEGKAVCVTGASGFIASWLIKFLLQRGYTVKATLRDPNDSKKTEHLRSLDGARERLQLFKADLLVEGSFDAAIDRCEGVFHTASPVFRPTDEPPVQLVEAAVKGTLNILKSCAKVPSVKRVIITSSMIAVIENGNPLTSDVVVDETWYSDVSVCESKKMWYAASKTMAEEAAWKFQKENGIDMVVLNPGLVIGPLLQPTLNLTTEIFFNHTTGAEKFPVRNYILADVRDVAEAHVQAFELPSANGRYCLVGEALHFSEILDILHDHYPTLRLPEISQDEKAFPPKFKTSTEKARSLGIEFTPVEVSVNDTFESLKARGYLNI